MNQRHSAPPRQCRWAPRVALCVWLACAATAAHADCFESAAAYHGVNPMILRAIANVESRGNPQAIHRNKNGTTDIGELQINSIHLRELAAFGIRAKDLLDECVNVYVAAWHLRKQIAAYGNTWDAVGAYHSRSPRLRDEYARLVKATLVKWGAMTIDGAAQ
ncbi:lytic transglycosylase domain-containing protein [Burkholderia sp. BCC0397]|uniref:lytic transglycosylase domain-containing protein n=1 Tax=Burkholderia sp. BCC0397 TaxID=486876 RepID=UPI00158F42EB|nr:lytic transglycosylase domain-containing protein [Burkholderia sp. BCC0397]